MKPRNKAESHWQFEFNDGRRICANRMRDSRRTKRGMRKQRKKYAENIAERLNATKPKSSELER